MKRFLTFATVFALAFCSPAFAGCGGKAGGLFGRGGCASQASYSYAETGTTTGGGGGLFAKRRARKASQMNNSYQSAFAPLQSSGGCGQASYSQTSYSQTASYYASPVVTPVTAAATTTVGTLVPTLQVTPTPQAVPVPQASPPPVPAKGTPQTSIVPKVIPVASVNYKLWSDPEPSSTIVAMNDSPRLY